MAIVINKRPSFHSFSGNPIWYELYSAAAAADPDIFFDIRIKFKYSDGTGISGPYDTVIDLPYYPVAGTAKIDLAAVLDSKLKYGLPGLPADPTEIYIAPYQTGFFYIEYREITPADPDPDWTTDAANKFLIIKGGINYFFHRGDNVFPNYFHAEAKHKFYTWQRSGRLASLTERMYLMIVPRWGITMYPLTLRAQIFWTDGTQNTVDVFGTFGMLNWQCLYMPAGATQMNLQAVDPAKTIHYWEVYIYYDNGLGNAGELTDRFRFYADNRNDYNSLTLNYRNSIGGLDSLRVRGRIDHNLNYELQETQKNVNPDYYTEDFIPAQKVMVNSSEDLTYKADAGFQRKEDQDRLRDLFIRREVWWELRNKWLPVHILTKSFKMRSSDDKLWSMPLEYSLAYAGGVNYTPQSIDLGEE